MDMTKAKFLRVVLRRFPASRVFLPGEVINTEGWTTVGSLERTRYLRPLQWGEEPFVGPHGRMWVSEEAYIARTGSPAEPATDDRASSAKGQATDADPSEQASTEAEGDSDALRKQEEGAEGEGREKEVNTRIQPDHIGGGWYNVLLDGKKHNTKALRQKDLEGYIEKLETELQKG